MKKENTQQNNITLATRSEILLADIENIIIESDDVVRGIADRLAKEDLTDKHILYVISQFIFSAHAHYGAYLRIQANELVNMPCPDITN